MTDKQQATAFANDLDALVSRYAQEFELSNAAAIGCLMLQIRAIEDSALECVEGDE